MVVVVCGGCVCGCVWLCVVVYWCVVLLVLLTDRCYFLLLFIHRLYKPRTPPTWPQPGEALGFGVRTEFANRRGLSGEAQKKWEMHATYRKTHDMESRVDRLAFLGEKVRV